MNDCSVVQGKIESIELPDGIDKVDIIISEWMGYALLYESMLDSVLQARERFLKVDGIMAPSQCQMLLALCDGGEVYKDRIDFWHDVYGTPGFGSHFRFFGACVLIYAIGRFRHGGDD